MRNIVSFSGGKDSTAVILLLKEQGVEFEAIFCDTGWEHKYTYEFIDEFNHNFLSGKLTVVRSEKYEDMRDLVRKKGRVPSNGARFCTEELKVKPMIRYLNTIDDDYIIYQGIRAEESKPRSKMKPESYSNIYDCWLKFPIFHWTSTQVMDIHYRCGVEPNKLYKLGASRVGCFPCVNINKGDLSRVRHAIPEVWDRAQELEDIAGRSFFRPIFVPDRFCSKEHIDKDGRIVKYPTVSDTKKYIERGDSQEEMFETPRCMSIYNLCE